MVFCFPWWPSSLCSLFDQLRKNSNARSVQTCFSSLQNVQCCNESLFFRLFLSLTMKPFTAWIRGFSTEEYFKQKREQFSCLLFFSLMIPSFVFRISDQRRGTIPSPHTSPVLSGSTEKNCLAFKASPPHTYQRKSTFRKKKQFRFSANSYLMKRLRRGNRRRENMQKFRQLYRPQTFKFVCTLFEATPVGQEERTMIQKTSSGDACLEFATVYIYKPTWISNPLLLLFRTSQTAEQFQ